MLSEAFAVTVKEARYPHRFIFAPSVGALAQSSAVRILPISTSGKTLIVLVPASFRPEADRQLGIRPTRITDRF